MPKEHREQKPNQAGQLSSEEKFRSFFTTTVVDLPKGMTQEDLPAPETEKKGGLFGRLFGKKQNDEPQEDMALEIPTGEILLGEEETEEPDMDLMLCTADPEPDLPLPAAKPEPKPEPKPQPKPEPKPQPKPDTKPEPKPQPAPEKPKQQTAPQPPKAERKLPQRKPPEVLLPQEEREQQEMQQLKALLGGMEQPKAKPKPAAQPKPEPKPEPKPQPKAEPMRVPEMVFASAGTPEMPQPVPEQKPVQEPEKPAQQPNEKEDTMSLPLLTLDEEAKPASSAPQSEQTAELPTEAEPTEELEPEEAADRLHRISAELTLRCVLAGILAVVLIHFGLVAEGLLPALSMLDPDAAPAAFYGANLLLMLASIAAGYPVVRDGLAGLRGRPSADTMPALAAVAAVLQGAVALLNADAYRAADGPTLLSGMAALGLALALLGSRVMIAAVRGGFELVSNGVEHQGAYRIKDKELIRTLSQSMERKDPWVLFSRPVTADESFVEQSLAERASERRGRKISYILLGAALLSGVLMLLTGNGLAKAVSAVTAILCMGAPLSSTLIAALAALRLQRSAATVGAVIPGWSAIEELGGIDTIQVDADDLFTADSVTLEDIRIFKGGRIDRAILYAASVLNQSSDTLRGLFHQIVEDRTDILFPIKDLEIHPGKGFSAWCDNNHIQIGTREYMEQEEIALPEQEYEAAHSKNGELQILYLSVSGNLHAMFVLKYVGGRNVARSLAALQKEGIRLLVSSKDPSLTARHIVDAYHLPEDMVTMLDAEQCAALRAAPADEGGACCLYHLHGFASLTGGLQAAEQAQNAETSATTVQLVSVVFSIAIGLLLTWANSVWQLSVATVLMYQAAWSALSIAVCALKQHN